MNQVLLTNLTLWDGTEIAEADQLLIQNGQIAALKDTAPDAQHIDCSGLTAIPGLIDAHVHLELDPNEQGAPSGTPDTIFPVMVERAQAMVKSGITTARDLGGGAWHELRLRNATASGEVAGPRLLCSGQPITCPQGHCHFWGGEAANLDEALVVMRRQLEHDVDLIKVMATGGRLTRGSDPLLPQFDLPTLQGIVDAAHGNGKPVAAHCHGTPGIEVAARAGVDTIEHCSWVGDEGWASDYQDSIAEVILNQGIWVSPTVNKGWQRMLDSKTGNVLRRVRSAYRKMIDMGIPMVASTDAGIPGVFHADLAHALVVFAQIAELSNEDTLRSATSDAARALGISDQTGRLIPGLAADVLLLDGNPLEDLTAITRPAGVWARGRAITLPS